MGKEKYEFSKDNSVNIKARVFIPCEYKDWSYVQNNKGVLVKGSIVIFNKTLDYYVNDGYGKIDMWFSVVYDHPEYFREKNYAIEYLTRKFQKFSESNLACWLDPKNYGNFEICTTDMVCIDSREKIFPILQPILMIFSIPTMIFLMMVICDWCFCCNIEQLYS